MSQRTEALADRLEQGARALDMYARDLSDEQWQTRIPHDGRKVGVVVHHVATMYPLEIQLAQALAKGEPIAGVTWDAVNQINAEHARTFAAFEHRRKAKLLHQGVSYRCVDGSDRQRR